MRKAEVILHVVDGEFAGTSYSFDEPCICTIGRSPSSSIEFSGEAGIGVSRKHCVLDVRPPRVFLRDAGSSNGTYVNGRNIGPEANDPGKPLMSVELDDNDIIQFGRNAMRVELVQPEYNCYVCNRVIREYDLESSLTEDGLRICRSCRRAGLKAPFSPAARTLRVVPCARCGLEVTIAPNSAARNLSDAEILCPDCKARVAQTASFPRPLLRKAETDGVHVPGYRILDRLGRGGSGIVYLAQDETTLEKVAIKLLLPGAAMEPECRADFIREAENLQALNHPNIVSLLGCRLDGDELLLITEYCAGGTIRDFLRKQGRPFRLRQALDLVYQILDALEYAHNVKIRKESLIPEQPAYTVHGLVHRDIKPANIFLKMESGILTPKIADFGIAKAFDDAGLSGCTLTGDFSGTLSFIPRQQYLNYKYVKPEVDVWATAATLYYMLVGSPPRDCSGGDPEEAFSMLPYPIQDLNDEVTPSIARVLNRALDDRGSLKFKTAASLKIALRNAEGAGC